MKLNSSKAFTLTEIIVSVIIIGIVSAFSWMAVSALNPTSIATVNRIKAQNLITKSQEELIRVARSNFDILKTCNFQAGNACGFVSDISNQFPGFSRNLTFVDPPLNQSTNELLQANISVSWQESGQARFLNSVLLLARPPDSLPGNVIGMIKKQGDPNPLSGVTVKIKEVNGPTTFTTTSAANPLVRPNGDGKLVNYSFTQPNTGRFLLKSGTTWRLTATKTGYQDYTYPQDIVLGSNDEQQIDFVLIPKPTNRIIKGNFKSGGATVSMNAFSSVGLYEKGTLFQYSAGGAGFQFSIPFPDNRRRCFTLATSKTYRSAYAGNYSCTPGLTLQADGMSYSQVRANDQPDCSLSWTGGEATDWICVSPDGDDLTKDINLVKVPSVIVRGIVRQTPSNAPIKNATVIAGWHDNGVNSIPWATTTTGDDGSYTISVPAEQAMFPNEQNYYAKIWVQTTTTTTRCCNVEADNVPLTTDPPARVGPLFPGSGIITQDFNINTTPSVQDCGNVKGIVKNDNPANPVGVNGVQVVLTALSQSTDGTGNYSFTCPAAGYKVPAGGVSVIVNDSRYYLYTSSGNIYYNLRTFNVAKGQNNDFGVLGLWPIGKGTVSGTIKVQHEGSNLPVAGIQVYLFNPLGWRTSVITQADGSFTFTDVPETWPPPLLVNNPAYNQTVRDLTLQVVSSNLYYPYPDTQFKLNAGDNKRFDILLKPQGSA